MTEEEIQHVYPVGDAMEHILSCIRYGDPSLLPYCPCPCKPEHQEVGNPIEGVTGLIIVHNSFDGREGVEWANEILTN